jgi:uncharacterized membrane protein YccC
VTSSSVLRQATPLVDSVGERVREELRDARDRWVASDPGLARLRQAVKVAVAVATTLGIEYLLSLAVGTPAVSLMLLGAVTAMLTATSVKENRRRQVLRAALPIPPIGVAGLALGVLAGEAHLLGVIMFVAVSFVAVWMRRFGPRFFGYGFLLWQAYFFALFLHSPLGDLPDLILAVLVASVWVGLLLLTVLYDDPQAKLRQVVAALRARARAVISGCLDLLDEPRNQRLRRRLRGQLVQLSEVVLLLDGQLADERALPDGVLPGRMRRWTVDVEIGIDEVCGAVLDLASADLSPELRAAVTTLLENLGWGQRQKALAAVGELRRLVDAAPAEHPLPAAAAVRRLAGATEFVLDTVEDYDSGGLRAELPGASADPLDDEDDFEPVVTLVNGGLPGTAALAEQSLGGATARRFSPARWKLSTRQAWQAAVAAGLAIFFGELVSSQRYYWAVISAFLAFAGAATAGESVSRAVGRVCGTLAGLVGAVGLANLTHGDPWLVGTTIVLAIALAFFAQPVSYTLMIFFITLMLGQLYTLLGTFSDEVLVLRLEETAVGAVIGIVVALLVFPASSSRTLRVARQTYLEGLAGLLDSAEQTLRGREPDADLLAQAVSLDALGRQLVRVRKTMTRGRLFGADRDDLRHRVSVLGASGAAARSLAIAVFPDQPQAELADVCAVLATEARRLAALPRLGPSATSPEGTPLTAEVRPLLDAAEAAVGRRPAVSALRRLSDTLSLLVPRPAVAASG